jgi:hypothetical protein
MSTPLADYQNERKALEALFQPDCRKRILMVCGESGSGKTSLLRHCLDRVPKSVVHIPIELRGSAVSVAEIFHRSGGSLKWDRLRNFTELVAELQGISKVQINRNWLVGINNHISVALQSESSDIREYRRVALTDAWFDDLRNFDKPILFALDTYEKATTEVQDWISGPFLARASQSDIVRVLVAGQTVPDEKNIEWGRCCETRHLYGVPEAEHWLPVVQEMGRYIDPQKVGHPMAWLAGVCHALKGRPGDIMKIIEALPPLKTTP